MKLRALVIVAFALLFVVAGCKGGGTEDKKDPKPKVESSKKDEGEKKPAADEENKGDGVKVEMDEANEGKVVEDKPADPPKPEEDKPEAKEAGPVTTASGLKYVDRVVGDGPSPTRGRRVTVHYTGTLADGSKFDSSVDRGRPFTFVIGVGQVISGWDEGVVSMKIGGKRQLIIPSDLGYGDRGSPPKIPGGATLYFEVELLGIQ